MFVDTLLSIWEASGFAAMTWQNGVMILVSFILIYLAIVKEFEPLLLLPIAFGMLLANLPIANLMKEPTETENGASCSRPRDFVPGRELFYFKRR